MWCFNQEVFGFRLFVLDLLAVFKEQILGFQWFFSNPGKNLKKNF